MTTLDATFHENSPDFLRWQVKVPQSRFEYYPLYDSPADDAKIIGYEPSSKTVRVMKLIGWGATRNAAVKMAMGNA